MGQPITEFIIGERLKSDPQVRDRSAPSLHVKIAVNPPHHTGGLVEGARIEFRIISPAGEQSIHTDVDNAKLLHCLLGHVISSAEALPAKTIQ